MENERYSTYAVKLIESSSVIGKVNNHAPFNYEGHGGILALEDAVLLESFLEGGNRPATELCNTASHDSSYDDLENLANDVIPLQRFRKKGKISVTDFSAQLWCEKQLEFSLVTGRKHITPSMIAGITRHETLEFNDHDVIPVEVYTREDALGLRLLNTIILLNQLLLRGKVREVWVFGIWRDIVVRGIIDQMELVNSKGNHRDTPGGLNVLISDTKTRTIATEPSDAQKRTSAFQLQMYWLMVNHLRENASNFEILLHNYQCDRYTPFQAKELEPHNCLDELMPKFQKAFYQLPPLWDEVKIDYEFNGKSFACCNMLYQPTSTEYTMLNLLDWWQGYREAETVLNSEKWKCRGCLFLDMCLLTPLDRAEIEAILKKNNDLKANEDSKENEGCKGNEDSKENEGCKGNEDSKENEGCKGNEDTKGNEDSKRNEESKLNEKSKPKEQFMLNEDINKSRNCTTTNHSSTMAKINTYENRSSDPVIATVKKFYESHLHIKSEQKSALVSKAPVTPICSASSHRATKAYAILAEQVKTRFQTPPQRTKRLSYARNTRKLPLSMSIVLNSCVEGYRNGDRMYTDVPWKRTYTNCRSITPDRNRGNIGFIYMEDSGLELPETAALNILRHLVTVLDVDVVFVDPLESTRDNEAKIVTELNRRCCAMWGDVLRFTLHPPESRGVVTLLASLLRYCLLRPDLSGVVEVVAPGLTSVLVPWIFKTCEQRTSDDTLGLLCIVMSRFAGHPLLVPHIQICASSETILFGLLQSMERWLQMFLTSDTVTRALTIVMAYGFQALVVILRITQFSLTDRLLRFHRFICLALQVLNNACLSKFSGLRLCAFAFLCVAVDFPSTVVERLVESLNVKEIRFSLFLRNNSEIEAVYHEPYCFRDVDPQDDIFLVNMFKLQRKTLCVNDEEQDACCALLSKIGTRGEWYGMRSKSTKDQLLQCHVEFLTELQMSPPNRITRALVNASCTPFQSFGIHKLNLWCRAVLPDRCCETILRTEPHRSLDILRRGALSVLGKSACLLLGPGCTGKSHTIETLYRLLSPPNNDANMHTNGVLWLYLDGDTDSRALIGAWENGESPGTFVWKDGVLVNAMTCGRWVVIENIDKCASELLSKIQEVVESRSLNIVERHRRVEANDQFQLFGTVTTASNDDNTSDAAAESRIPPSFRAWQVIRFPRFTQQEIEILSASLYPAIAHIVTYLYTAFYSVVEQVDGRVSKELSRGLSHKVFFRYLQHVQSALDGKRICVPLLEVQRLTLLEEFYFTVAVRYSYVQYRRYLCVRFGTALGLTESQVLDHTSQRYIVSVEDCLQVGTLFMQFNPTNSVGRSLVRKVPFLYTSVHARVLRAVVGALLHRESVLLVGPTGCGKTALVQKLATVLGFELVVYNFNDQSESCDLVGRIVQKNAAQLIAAVNDAWMTLIDLTPLLNDSQRNYLRANLELRRASGQYKRYLSLACMVCKRMQVMLSESSLIADKATRLLEWSRMERRLEDLQNHPLVQHEEAAGCGGSLRTALFAFEEGALVSALRKGQWIVLDEINLAPPDILQRIRGLLGNYSSVTTFVLTENGGEEVVPHPDFRLFGCMNPSLEVIDLPSSRVTDGEVVESSISVPVMRTSAGKKELPPDIRSCFTEICVDEVTDLQDVAAIVEGLLPQTKGGLAEQIALFYTEARQLCSTCAILTVLNGSPHFSLRTLTRALEFASTVVGRPWKPRTLLNGVIDGILANFITGLAIDSFNLMVALLSRCLRIPEKLIGSSTSITGRTEGKTSQHMANVEYAIEKIANITTEFHVLQPELFMGGPLPSGKGDVTGLNTCDVTSLFINEVVLRSPKASNGPNCRWVSIEGFPLQCGTEMIDFMGAHKALVITPSVKCTVRNIARILSGSRVPILLEGPTSSGKSSIVRFICQLTGHRFVRINNHDHTDVQEYLGQHMIHPKSGKLVFVEGAIAQAAREGHWVVLDELNLAPSEVLESLNRLLDGNRQLFLPETGVTIDAHPDFMIFATQNPAGSIYGGRKVLSPAFRNRFIEMSCEELPLEELDIILQWRCSLPPSFTKSMLNVFQKLKMRRLKASVFESCNSFMTIRDLLKWGLRRPESKEQLACEGYFLIAERLRDSQEKAQVLCIIRDACVTGNTREPLELNFQEDAFVSSVKTALTCTLPLHVPQLSITNSMARLIALVERAIAHNEPVLLVGDTGTGKTSLCQLLACVHAVQLRIVNCHQQTEAADFLGSLQPIKDYSALYHCVAQQEQKLLNVLQKSLILFTHMLPQEFSDMTSLFQDVYQCVEAHMHSIEEDNHDSLLGLTRKTDIPAPPYKAQVKTRLVDFQLSMANWLCKLEEVVGNPESGTDVSNASRHGVFNQSKSGLETGLIKKRAYASSNQPSPLQTEDQRATLPTRHQETETADERSRNIQAFVDLKHSVTQDIPLLLNALEQCDHLFEWVDGPLVRCMREGAYLLLDEISLADDAVLERLNCVLEPERSLVLTEKGCGDALIGDCSSTTSSVSFLETIVAEPTFRIFATMNPGGDFGKRELSPALRNRFTEIFVPPIDFASPDILQLLRERIEAKWLSVASSFHDSIHDSIHDSVHDHQQMQQLTQELTQEQPFIVSEAQDCETFLMPLAVSLQKTMCWYNACVEHTLSVREILSWVDFLCAFVSKCVNSPEHLCTASLRDIVVEGFFHGAFLTCIDSFGIGNRLRAACVTDTEGDSSCAVPQKRFYEQFLDFLLTVARGHLGMTDTHRLYHQFQRDGFGWLYDAIAQGTDELSVIDAEGRRHIKVPPFRVACRESQVEARPSQERTPFKLDAPTTVVNFGRVLRALQLPKAILLEGPPGAGKTSIVQAVADLIGVKLVRINLSEQTDLCDLLGSNLPGGTRLSLWGDRPSHTSFARHAFRWVDGVLIDAMVNGDWVLLDELNLASQQVLEGLNALLDHRQEIFLPELNRVVRCSPWFRLFAAQNPMLDGGGRRGLPRSFLNRFSRIMVTQLTQQDLETIAFSQAQEHDKIGHVLQMVNSIKKENQSKPFSGSTSWEWNLRDVFRFMALVKEKHPSHNILTSASLVLLSRLVTSTDLTRAITCLRSVAAVAPSDKGSRFITRGLQQDLADLQLTAPSTWDSTSEPPNACHTLALNGFSLPLRTFVQCSTDTTHFGTLGVARLGTDGPLHRLQSTNIVGYLPSQEHIVAHMSYGVAYNWCVLLTGSLGCGKTSAIRYLAHLCSAKLHVFTLTESVDISELLGTYEPETMDGLLNTLKEQLATMARDICFAALESTILLQSVNTHLHFLATMLSSGEKDFLTYVTPQVPLHEMETDDLPFTRFSRFLTAMETIHHTLTPCLEKAHLAQRLTAIRRLVDVLRDRNASSSSTLRFHWNDGLLLQCVERGDWLLLRHIHVASPSLLDRLNSLLEPNGFLLLTECGAPCVIRAHPRFRLFLTTESDSVQGTRLSRALRNRCLEINFNTWPLTRSYDTIPEKVPKPSPLQNVDTQYDIRRLVLQLLAESLKQASVVGEEHNVQHVRIAEMLFRCVQARISTADIDIWLDDHAPTLEVEAFDHYAMASCGRSCDESAHDFRLLAVLMLLCLRLVLLFVSFHVEHRSGHAVELTSASVETSETLTLADLCLALEHQGFHEWHVTGLSKRMLQRWMASCSVASFALYDTTSNILWDSFQETYSKALLQNMKETSRSVVLLVGHTLFTSLRRSKHSSLWSHLQMIFDVVHIPVEPSLFSGDRSTTSSPAYHVMNVVTETSFHRHHRLQSVLRYTLRRCYALWKEWSCQERQYALRMLRLSVVQYIEKLHPHEIQSALMMLERLVQAGHPGPHCVTFVVSQILHNLHRYHTFLCCLGERLATCVTYVGRSAVHDLSPVQQFAALVCEDLPQTPLTTTHNPDSFPHNDASVSMGFAASLTELYRHVLHLLMFLPGTTAETATPDDEFSSSQFSLDFLHDVIPLTLWDWRTWKEQSRKDQHVVWMAALLGRCAVSQLRVPHNLLPNWMWGPYTVSTLFDEIVQQMVHVFSSSRIDKQLECFVSKASQWLKMVVVLCRHQVEGCLLCAPPDPLQTPPADVSLDALTWNTPGTPAYSQSPQFNTSQDLPYTTSLHNVSRVFYSYVDNLTTALTQKGVDKGIQQMSLYWFTQKKIRDTYAGAHLEPAVPCSSLAMALILHDPISSIKWHHSFYTISQFFLHASIHHALSRGWIHSEASDDARFFHAYEDIVHLKATLTTAHLTMSREPHHASLLNTVVDQAWKRIAPQCNQLLKAPSVHLSLCDSGEASSSFVVDAFVLVHISTLFEHIVAPQMMMRHRTVAFHETPCDVIRFLHSTKTFLVNHVLRLLRTLSPYCASVVASTICDGLSTVVSAQWQLEYAHKHQRLGDEAKQVLQRTALACIVVSRHVLSSMKALNQHYQSSEGNVTGHDAGGVEQLFIVDPNQVASLCSATKIRRLTATAAPSDVHHRFMTLDPQRFVAWRSALALRFSSLIDENVTLQHVESLAHKACVLQQLMRSWDDTRTYCHSGDVASHPHTCSGARTCDLWCSFILQGISDLCYRVVLLKQNDLTSLNETSFNVSSLNAFYVELFSRCRCLFHMEDTLRHELRSVVVRTLNDMRSLQTSASLCSIFKNGILNDYALLSLNIFHHYALETSWAPQCSVSEGMSFSSDHAVEASPSTEWVYRVLWHLSLWRLSSCATFVGGEARRDMLALQALSLAEDEAHQLECQAILERYQSTWAQGSSVVPTSLQLYAQSGAHKLRTLVEQVRAVLPLRPPLTEANMSTSEASIFNVLKSTGALDHHNSTTESQLKALQQELCHFVSCIWSTEKLRNAMPWMFSITQHDVAITCTSVTPSPFLEMAPFLINSTSTFLDAMALRYPLFQDVLSGISAAFQLSFYSALSSAPTYVLQSAALCVSLPCSKHTHNCVTGMLHTDEPETQLPGGVLTSTQVDTPLEERVEYCLYKCECFEYAFDHCARPNLDLHHFRTLFFQLCSFMESHYESVKLEEQQRFKLYIQKQQDPPHDNPTDDGSDTIRQCDILFPQGQFSRDEEGLDTDPLCFGQSSPKSQNTGRNSPPGATAPSCAAPAEHAPELSTVSPHQLARFSTLIYNLSYSVLAGLSNARTVYCTRTTAPETLHGSFSATDPHHALTTQHAFCHVNLLRTSLGYKLRKYAGSVLPKAFDDTRPLAFHTLLVHGLLASQAAQLFGAMNASLLSAEYHALFERDQDALLIPVDDMMPESSQDTQGNDVARARQRHAAYKSQKIRFHKIQRLLRSSTYSVWTDSGAVSSFYGEAWPSACVSIYPSIKRLHERIRTLLLEFDDHPALVPILHLVNTIAGLPIFLTTPVSLINVLELLISKCDKWEVFAHRTISLKPNMAELQKHLLLLRHHQLNDWKQLRNHREEQQCKVACGWVPLLLGFVMDLCTHHAQSRFSSHVPWDACQELWCYLEHHVLTKPIGEFDARVRVITVVGQLMGCHQEGPHVEHAAPQLACVLNHFAQYCELVRPRVEQYIAVGRDAMDTTIATLLRVTAWDFSKPDALRLAIQKAHHQLTKAVTSFDAHLQTIVVQCLTGTSLVHTLVLDDANKRTDMRPASSSGTLPHQSQGLDRLVSRMLMDSCNTAPSCTASQGCSFSSCIAWLSTQLGHGALQPSVLPHWTRCLHSDIQQVLPAIEGAHVAQKRRWIQELRDRLNHLDITRSTMYPEFSVLASPTGLFTMDSLAHVLLGIPTIPLDHTSLNPLDPIGDLVQTCLPTTTKDTHVVCILGMAPMHWQFIQHNFYCQVRQFTLLKGQQASCHADLVDDRSNVFWITLCNSLVRVNQRYMDHVWVFSQQFTEFADLVYIATRRSYRVDAYVLRRLWSSLDTCREIIRQCLFFHQTASACESSLPHGRNLGLKSDSPPNTNPIPPLLQNPCSHDRPTAPQSIEGLFAALGTLRDVFYRLPESRAFQRDHCVCFLTFDSRCILLKALDSMAWAFNIQTSSPFLTSSFSDQVMAAEYIPVALRKTLLVGLEEFCVYSSALLLYEETHPPSPRSVPELPYCTTQPFIPLPQNEVHSGVSPLPSDTVDVEYALKQASNVDLSRWIRVLKEDCFDVKSEEHHHTIEQMPLTPPSPRVTQIFGLQPHLKSALIYALTLLVTALDANVALSGITLFAIKTANLLFKNGYCREQDSEEQGTDAVDTAQRDTLCGGTGMGEGHGAHDVSKEIPDQHLLDGYDHETPEPRDTPNDDHADARDQNEDCFPDDIEHMAPTLCDLPQENTHDEPQQTDNQEPGDVSLDEGNVEKKRKAPDIDETEETSSQDGDLHKNEQVETENGEALEILPDLVAGEDPDTNSTPNTSKEPKQKNNKSKETHSDDNGSLSDSDQSYDDDSVPLPLHVAIQDASQPLDQESQDIDMDHTVESDHASDIADFDDAECDASVCSDASMDNEQNELSSNDQANEDVHDALPDNHLDPDQHDDTTEKGVSGAPPVSKPQSAPYGVNSSHSTHSSTLVENRIDVENQWPSSNLDAPSLKKQDHCDTDAQNAIEPQNDGVHSSSATNNTPLSYAAKGDNQASHEPSIPNPLLPENSDAIDQWIRRITLTDALCDDAEAPLPEGVEQEALCKRDETSSLKGSAEVNDSTHSSSATRPPPENDEYPSTSSNVDAPQQRESTLQQPSDTITSTDTSQEQPQPVSEKDDAPLKKDVPSRTAHKSLQSRKPNESTENQEQRTHRLTVTGSTVSPDHSSDLSDSSETSHEGEEYSPHHTPQPSSVCVPHHVAKEFWDAYGLETNTSATQLCEQLRIILEPTLRSRFAEGYRTGKRLSMRKVLTFIASNYRRDKIWMRRCRPSRRDYQILIALDNSRSMSECGVGRKALKSIVMVAKAFQRLELGKTALCAFGGTEPQVILPLQDNVYDENTGADIIRSFTFDKESPVSYDQALPELFDLAFELFDQAPLPQGGPCVLQRMVLILSDGRFNKRAVFAKIHQAMRLQLIPIFLILDNVHTEPKDVSSSRPRETHSIFDLKEAVWTNGNINLKSYLHDFPFPFYAVVQEVSSLPDVVADVVRQWLEMLNAR